MLSKSRTVDAMPDGRGAFATLRVPTALARPHLGGGEGPQPGERGDSARILSRKIPDMGLAGPIGFTQPFSIYMNNMG